MKKLFALISALSVTAISLAQPLVKQSQLINFPGRGSGGGNAESFLKSRHKLPENVRISCQTKVVGNITIDATYW